MSSASIRATIQSRRNALSPAEIRDASIEISRNLWKLPILSRARRIACYYPVGNEVDCLSFMSAAWERGRTVLLPPLQGPELQFLPCGPGTEFLRNRYGIPEPIADRPKTVRPREIDVVLMPLVAFDDKGNRIGMGGGYYDRSFRFMRHRCDWQRPKLVGLAYELQKVPKIKARSWDVPVQCVLTETTIYRF